MHSVSFGRLMNGLRVVTIQRPHLHRSVVSAYIEVGSRHETPRTNGLSHFLEHMLFRGTAQHPTAYALNDAIESLGGSLMAATHGDYTLFDVTVPPARLEGACALMGGIFTRPIFSQIEVEKGIVREEILENLDDDHRDVNADNLSRMQVFGQHPLGYPITGTLANVDRFTITDLRRHLSRHYRADNMVVSVCSPVGHRQVMRAVERGFSDLASGAPAGTRTARVAQRRARLRAVNSAGSQTSVRVAFPTPGENTSIARAIDVLMRVLDDGMSTRLHRRICDELGLAYEVSAGVELFQDVGVMDVASSVAHGSVVKLVSEVLEMLGDLALEGPSRAELEKVQHRYAFDLASMDDDPHGLADFYGAPALWNREEDIVRRRRDVLALSTDELRRAARVVFSPQRLNLTTVGTADPACARGLREAVRQFRVRLTRHTVSVAPRPPIKVRERYQTRVSRGTAALDSSCAPP